MKTIYWVFAIFVFVLSLVQPAFAGCGSNAGLYSSTKVPPPTPLPTPPTANTATGAGMLRK